MTRGPSELEGDITLNALRYVLGENKQRGRAWWEGPSKSNQEGSIEVPVSATWPNGWYGGMGETTRVGPDSYGNAFTVGFDTTPFGYARLASTKKTISIGTAPTGATYGPVDKPMFGIEDGSTTVGDAVFEVSGFAKEASGGDDTQTFTIPANTKALFLWSGGAADGTVAAGGSNFIGITDGTTARSASWNSEDNAADANSAKFWSTSAICLQTATGTATPPLGAVTWTGTTATVVWTNNDASTQRIHYTAFCGTDVQASVDEWTAPAAAGDRSVTGIDFSPDLCIHLSASATSVGSSSQANYALGAMDASGNQWCVSGEVADADAASNSSRRVSWHAIRAPFNAISMVSMDADGFTVREVLGAAKLMGTLSIKGLRVKAGYTTKKTSSGSQAAEAIGFTTTAFVVASNGHTVMPSYTDSALFSLGAASGTTAVESSCWSDEDAQDPTDTYSVDDPALAMEIHDLTDGTEDNLATCGAISMETAGWLEWSASDANASIICYLALAPLATSASGFITIFNGQHAEAFSITSNVITEVNAKDFGAAAQCGRPAKFGSTPKWYIPLGQTAYAQTLDTVTAAGVQTYAALGTNYSQAFAVTIEGAATKLNRAHSGNQIDVSTDGTTFGADFTACDKAETITSLIDSGTDLFVFTNANAWHMIGGLSRKLTRFASKDQDEDFGSGSMVPAGSAAFYYNHRGISFYDGDRVHRVDPDANPVNQAIPNVSYEPVGMEITELVYASDSWVWAAARLTEASVTKTYILAGRRTPGEVPIVWHTWTRFDGVARLVPIDGNIDSQHRLWFADISGGKWGYFLLGNNGEPDAGRDSLGRGEASTTYELYLPATDMGLPGITKQFRSIEITTEGMDATAPMSPHYQLGNSAVTNAALNPTSYTNSAFASYAFFFTSSNAGVYLRPIFKITTTAGYTPTTLDPKVYTVIVRATARPDYYREIEIWVDTEAPLADGSPQLYDPTAIRTAIRALQNAAPVTCVDPDGTTRTLLIQDVTDLSTRVVGGVLHYTLGIKASAWNTSTTST